MNYPRKIEIDLDKNEIALTTVKTKTPDYPKEIENIRVKFSEAEVTFISGEKSTTIEVIKDTIIPLFHTDEEDE